MPCTEAYKEYLTEEKFYPLGTTDRRTAWMKGRLRGAAAQHGGQGKHGRDGLPYVSSLCEKSAISLTEW